MIRHSVRPAILGLLLKLVDAENDGTSGDRIRGSSRRAGLGAGRACPSLPQAGTRRVLLRRLVRPMDLAAIDIPAGDKLQIAARQ